MQEAIEIGRMLHDAPDLFPWVCLTIFLIFVYSQHSKIASYFDARIDCYRTKKEMDEKAIDMRKQSDAVLAELIRNNTAALNNNTAALEAVKNDRGQIQELIRYHENASKERIDALHDDISHVQIAINRIDETVHKNDKNITIIKESKGRR